jgi:glucan 1,3-beta-glucosidase
MSRWFIAPAFALALMPLLAYWWTQGRAVAVAEAPSSQVPCVSYAPYRDGQTPFDEDLVIPAAQIAEDLARLQPITRCVRTYSVDHGLAEVPAIARDLDMTVMLGAWIGRERQKNEKELEKVIELAQRYPESVKAVIVGNEVLLRREQPPAALKAMIERVRAAVPMPVTYADVWEFWQKHPEVAEVVDFITIHTLPYWEDEPQAIDEAVPHVLDIWRQMSTLFPDRRVLIGEAGWPSAGRMREGARPGPVEQARFLRELMIAADKNDIDLNVIEAFDQPWKRKLEGTVGGHWGLLNSTRRAKFALQGPVSGEPRWLALFGASAGLAMLLLVPAVCRAPRMTTIGWICLAFAAAFAGVLLVQGIRDGIDGSRTFWDWATLFFRAATGTVAAVLAMEGLVAGTPRLSPLPAEALLEAIRRFRRPAAPWREAVLGAARTAALFGAAASTLCLLFDARYRDFAAALIAVPAFSFLLLALAARRRPRGGGGERADLGEERLLAAVLAVGAVSVAISEGMANHQALAWAGVSLVFSVSVMIDRGRQQQVAARYRRSSAMAPSSAPPAESSGA